MSRFCIAKLDKISGLTQMGKKVITRFVGKESKGEERLEYPRRPPPHKLNF